MVSMQNPDLPNRIYVVESIEATKGKIDELREALLEIVPLSKQEKGCIYYNLFQDQDDPSKFLVQMCWQNRKAYEAHISAPFIRLFEKKYNNILYQNVQENFYQFLSGN